MIERVAYPAGVPCWLDTAQPDPDAAARFYGGLFGWELAGRMPAGASGSYLVATLEASTSPGSARCRPAPRRRRPG